MHSRVVAAFHHVSAVLLEDPAVDEVATDVLVLGDDRDATDLVVALAGRVAGMRGVYKGEWDLQSRASPHLGGSVAKGDCLQVPVLIGHPFMMARSPPMGQRAHWTGGNALAVSASSPPVHRPTTGATSSPPSTRACAAARP